MTANVSMSSNDRRVRIAAVLLATYGIGVVVNAIVWQTLGGWQDAPDFARALVRCFGTGLIAWGLIKRRRWAWWMAVVLPSFWLLAGGLAMVLYFVPGSVIAEAIPGPMAAFIAASCAALAATVIILLRRGVREHFQSALLPEANSTPDRT